MVSLKKIASTEVTEFDCHFKISDMSFQCLGSWPGEDGQTYMSLLDTKLPQLGEEPRPRYRCAVGHLYSKECLAIR